MSRTPASFKQTDVSRAVKAMRAAGAKVRGVKINPRTGVIEVLIDEQESRDPLSANEWDTAR